MRAKPPLPLIQTRAHSITDVGAEALTENNNHTGILQSGNYLQCCCSAGQHGEVLVFPFSLNPLYLVYAHERVCVYVCQNLYVCVFYVCLHVGLYVRGCVNLCVCLHVCVCISECRPRALLAKFNSVPSCNSECVKRKLTSQMFSLRQPRLPADHDTLFTQYMILAF